MFRSDDDIDDNSSSNGTADAARTRVRSYFAGLREQLNRQEVAALTVVDTHIRERLCAIRQQEEDIATILSQVRFNLSESFENMKCYLQLFYCFLSVIICAKLPSGINEKAESNINSQYILAQNSFRSLLCAPTASAWRSRTTPNC